MLEMVNISYFLNYFFDLLLLLLIDASDRSDGLELNIKTTPSTANIAMLIAA